MVTRGHSHGGSGIILTPESLCYQLDRSGWRRMRVGPCVRVRTSSESLEPRSPTPIGRRSANQGSRRNAPFTAEHLKAASLAPEFIQYMRNWKGFVA